MHTSTAMIAAAIQSSLYGGCVWYSGRDEYDPAYTLDSISLQEAPDAGEKPIQLLYQWACARNL